MDQFCQSWLLPRHLFSLSFFYDIFKFQIIHHIRSTPSKQVGWQTGTMSIDNNDNAHDNDKVNEHILLKIPTGILGNFQLQYQNLSNTMQCLYKQKAHLYSFSYFHTKLSYKLVKAYKDIFLMTNVYKTSRQPVKLIFFI